jgi:hypothetical protein
MSAVTFSPALTPVAKAAAKPAAKAQKGFWTRVWDRIVEARMRQVEREIRLHMSYLPKETLEQYKNLPFQR